MLASTPPLEDDMNLDSIEAYDYELPDELIAAHPATRRVESRLMRLDPSSDALTHHAFSELAEMLEDGDVLVFNDASVVPGRVLATKSGTGGKVELLALGVRDAQGAPVGWTDTLDEVVFEGMGKANKRPRPGATLDVEGDEMEVLEWDAGRVRVKVRLSEQTPSPLAWLERHGELPLPPYIVKRREELGEARRSEEDEERYQTVLASTPGAIAAPTAGLHFSRDFLSSLEAKGVRIATVTLHVGPGTFQPVRTALLSEHEMHSERYVVTEELRRVIEGARARGSRIVTVGTTSMRALESEARRDEPFTPGERSTDIFLKPGHGPKLVDALVTNFHLPRSTLLALVSSMAGHTLTMRAYAEAVEQRYRFYSYGDAMFICGRKEA